RVVTGPHGLSRAPRVHRRVAGELPHTIVEGPRPWPLLIPLLRQRSPPRRPAVMRVWPGIPAPLGATWDGKGVNFALFSEHATQVELCLFERVDATQETHRLPL